jgi:hypothetical protein
MTDERMSGVALIAGSVVIIITMTLHPSGRIAPGNAAQAARMFVAVHSLVLFSLPVMFLGAWGMSRRVATAGRLPIVALVTYTFALAAIMNSAVAGGLVVSSVLRQLVAAAPGTTEAWQVLFRYNGWVDESFAQVYVVASSLAILLWSASIVRSRALPRALGIYGCILGPLTLIAIFSGLLNLAAHGFGLVVFGQALWFTITGALLCRARTPGPASRGLAA